MIQTNTYIDPFILATHLEILKDKKILILGATGQVGRRILSILASNNFPHENLTLVASQPKSVSYGIKTLQVLELAKTDLSEFDLIFGCAPSEVIKENISSVWNEQCILVDKSSAFRMDSDAALIVPEINQNLIKGKKILCSPNCVAIPLSMTLDAILPVISEVKHVSVSTYQSVSGAGDKAMQALIDETHETFIYNPKVMPRFFDKQIAFNLLPKIGEFDEDYSTEEENKICNETNFLLNRKLPISVNCVRVPVMIGHVISLQLACEFRSILDVESKLLEYNGIKYIEQGKYLAPIEIVNEDYVYVTRLKRNLHGLSMFILTDNLQKGAALNAIQIAISAFQS